MDFLTLVDIDSLFKLSFHKYFSLKNKYQIGHPTVQFLVGRNQCEKQSPYFGGPK
jgi:hypothetical protein